MALLTGQELADALDLDYDDPYEDALDQVAAAADDIVGTLITAAALTAEPPAVKEAALAVGVEIFQARTASGGQADRKSTRLNSSHVRTLPANRAIISNTTTASWIEDGPRLATAENVANLGRDVAIYGYGITAIYNPCGIVRL